MRSERTIDLNRCGLFLVLVRQGSVRFVWFEVIRWFQNGPNRFGSMVRSKRITYTVSICSYSRPNSAVARLLSDYTHKQLVFSGLCFSQDWQKFWGLFEIKIYKILNHLDETLNRFMPTSPQQLRWKTCKEMILGHRKISLILASPTGQTWRKQVIQLGKAGAYLCILMVLHNHYVEIL